MRNLGQMGENTFSLWCADVGLVANGSQIDITGWDFFVEFPFYNSCDSYEVHKAAIECKVQVKATDKNDRKLQITLSNLRRLITLQMPAFFVFIEFDGGNTSKRAFVVHVDNTLISNVLERLHKIEQSKDENKLNKRTMTIHYDESNELKNLNGSCLKKALESYIGNDFSKYIKNKINHLKSTGFEDGFGLINFTIDGSDNIKKLINSSLGVKNKIDVSNFKLKHQRFGIENISNFLELDDGKIEIIDVKPNADGKIIFKKDNLSIGLVFNCKIFISPFNNFLPKELQNIRIEGEFFEFVFNPKTGVSNYSFSFGKGFRCELNKFRSALELLKLLSSINTSVIAELIFDGYPSIQLKLRSLSQEFLFEQELYILECSIKMLSEFNITSYVDISLKEISQYGELIIQFSNIFCYSSNKFKIEFTIVEDYKKEFNPKEEAACIYFVSILIGSVLLGSIIVFTGLAKTKDDLSYELIVKDVYIEKKIAIEASRGINKNDIINELTLVEQKYESKYSTITMYDKNS